jgi:hypothetical protein
MRTIHVSLIAMFAATGCYSTMKEPRGVTRASYAGTTRLVFTNATPARMCNLAISSDTDAAYGDNWLPEDGLASGASLELRVQPGTYKATWSTCRDDVTQPFYAGTLYRELAFSLDRQEAQLYAFVADSVAPTKRAPVLGRQFELVAAAGQMIDPKRASIAAVPSHAERRLLEGHVPATATTSTKIDLHDCIDPALAKASAKKRSAKAKTKRTKRPDVAVAAPSVHRKVRMF